MSSKNFNDIQNSINYIKSQIFVEPKIGIILGSGLDIFQELDKKSSVSYSQIPNFPIPTVSGHSGTLTTGVIKNKAIAILRGRYHLYEGYDEVKVLLPCTLLSQLGVKIIIITNAAGGLNYNFNVGDLMVIKDHINFQTQFNYSKVINKPIFNTRFYDPNLIKKLKLSSLDTNIELKEGIYLCGNGPTYETLSEVNMFIQWGADAVGMSTVPEVVWANYLGLKVLAISCITNLAYKFSTSDSHEEVLNVSKTASSKLQKILERFIELIEL